MKKAFLLCISVCTISLFAHAQFMVAKLVSKGDAKYGMGYGLFGCFDYPLRNENQSIRIEILELTGFPTKGEKFFTSTKDAKGYLSAKLGYKYVFSETRSGFYLAPSAGYCRVVFAEEGKDADYGDGVAGALEAGHTWEVGEREHTINVGLKYEYDYGGAAHQIQSLGLRASFGFGLGRRNN